MKTTVGNTTSLGAFNLLNNADTSKRLNNNSRGCNPWKRNAHFPATLKRVECIQINRADIEPFRVLATIISVVRRLHLRLLLLNPDGFDFIVQ
jgi:hypothetical protein